MDETERSSHQLGIDSGAVEVGGAGARDHHHRDAGRNPRAQAEAEALAHVALDTVALHRVADPARDGDAQSRALIVVVKFTRVDHEVGALGARAAALKAQEFGASMQPVDGCEAHRRTRPD